MFGTKDQTKEIINLTWDNEKYAIFTAGNMAPTKEDLRELHQATECYFRRNTLRMPPGIGGDFTLRYRSSFGHATKREMPALFGLSYTVYSLTPSVLTLQSGCS
jgi:hypothetical protein